MDYFDRDRVVAKRGQGQTNLGRCHFKFGTLTISKEHVPLNLKKPLKTLTNKPFVTMINFSFIYKGFDEEEYV